MKALNRKLIRDLATMKGQALAIAAVLGCGIAILVMSTATLDTLATAKDTYYARHRFADVFVSLVRAPQSLAERVARIDGVASADHRIVEALTLDMPGLAEPAGGQIISLPLREEGGLNRVYLKSGRMPAAGRVGEVLVGETFAAAHRLEPGAKIEAIIRGRKQTLTMTGLALSPEHIIQVQPGSFFPDDLRFGVFWMERRQLEAASDMTGAFNNLTLQLARQANAEEVIRRLDRLLEPYGGSGAHTRESQPSARFVEDELRGLRIMGLVPPAIFLGVAAFLLNISLRRILAMQREQIAALKAFGYTNFEVGWHYAKLAGVIVLLGAAAGCAFGTWMGHGMVDLYRAFYHFPITVFAPGLEVYLLALSLALAAGALGVFSGVRDTIRLPPAEAMRPEPPATYRASALERAGLRHLLSQPARMVVREISRRPVKAALTSLGIALACAILMVGNFGKDSIDYLVSFQFGIAERDDARVQFVEAASARALAELRRVEGVLHAEPFRAVAARLRHGPRSKQLGITGVPEDSRLFRLMDRTEQAIPLRGGGVVISTVLADLLDVRVGDEVTIEVLEGERPVRQARVSGLVADFTGTAAYMQLTALNRLLGEGRVISGAYLQLDSQREERVYSELKKRPGVAAVSLKKATIRSFMDTVAETMLQMRFFNVLFSCVIAVGVVYSSARISFSERGRDLATLRVIGLTQGEVSAILLGELAFLTLAAIPAGLAIGHGLCLLMAATMSTELFRIPFVINPASYGFAAVVVLAASALSGWIVRRKINQLDLISALKISE